MSLDGEIEAHLRTLHPDGTLLELDPEEETFFKAETGIQDTEELRKHIIEVQEEAYKVFPYPCIRMFRFAKLKIARMPAYPRVLELAKSRPDAIFLDIGCCLGAEVRKVIHDGWPMSQTIATDLEAGFWDLGHRLFKTTPETYPAKFLAGDAFDDAHLSPTAPVPPGPPPSVASVNTLTELRGHISAIHASSFFHLFNEEKQFELGKRLAALLDPRPGSIIFGAHAGMPVKGQPGRIYAKMFCHSPESWTQMWEEQIFKKGQVTVTTVLREIRVVDESMEIEGIKFYFLAWSVERL
ncbi:hypothetical protein BDM02DRAFT_1817741 [Thelephora ganbajun]|uniref:Uncharacterized protein n=1 Tax=Thelephora ganbajun TaxID=370292 RepID=A0ACB6ZIW0_THEGA|nr:hypothetical protein BDM02DRAFT_1817741 [Thelephora ganbajun]